MCCSRLTAWPKVFLQMLQPKGLVPLCDLLTWTSSPWGVEKTYSRFSPLMEVAGFTDTLTLMAVQHVRVWGQRGAYLVTGDAVVGVGGGGVVRAAVQRLLRLWAAADVVAVQAAGVLKHRGAEAHLTELVGGRHRLPGVRGFVVRRECCHVRLWGSKKKSCFTSLVKSYTAAEKDGGKCTGNSPFR